MHINISWSKRLQLLFVVDVFDVHRRVRHQSREDLSEIRFSHSSYGMNHINPDLTKILIEKVCERGKSR